MHIAVVLYCELLYSCNKIQALLCTRCFELFHGPFEEHCHHLLFHTKITEQKVSVVTNKECVLGVCREVLEQIVCEI